MDSEARLKDFLFLRNVKNAWSAILLYSAVLTGIYVMLVYMFDIYEITYRLCWRQVSGRPAQFCPSYSEQYLLLAFLILNALPVLISILVLKAHSLRYNLLYLVAVFVLYWPVVLLASFAADFLAPYWKVSFAELSEEIISKSLRDGLPTKCLYLVVTYFPGAVVSFSPLYFLLKNKSETINEQEMR